MMGKSASNPGASRCPACGYCSKPLGTSWISCNDSKYHQECYLDHVRPKCGICREPIDGKYVKHENQNYHETCYKEHVLPKCDICGKVLAGRYVVDHWGNKSHTSHRWRKPLRCSCCGRLVSDTTSRGGYELNDGRILCGVCAPDSVQDITRVASLIHGVKALLMTVGIAIPEIREIVLVDRKLLRKSLRKDALGAAQTTTAKQGDTIVSMEHRICILHSLQKLVFGGVLAHEMLHTWLNQNRIPLGARETEGFCNLGSYLVYNKDRSPLAAILLEQMESDKDPVYGAGYRQMKGELDRWGWPGLLRRLRQ